VNYEREKGPFYETPCIRTPWAIKTCHFTFVHIFANYEHLYSPQQMVAITTYLQYKQWKKKRKKEQISI